jgi:hypothetical protein
MLYELVNHNSFINSSTEVKHKQKRAVADITVVQVQIATHIMLNSKRDPSQNESAPKRRSMKNNRPMYPTISYHFLAPNAKYSLALTTSSISLQGVPSTRPRSLSSCPASYHSVFLSRFSAVEVSHHRSPLRANAQTVHVG